MSQNNPAQNDPSIRAALYARVSSEQQAQAGTIQSQVAAIVERAAGDGLTIEPESRFIDDGHSGATLIRPALDRLRDIASAGGIDRLYVLCPDRLARSYAYQMLLVDELRRCGVELAFVNRDLGTTPEDHLLLQVQGVVAEYERAKIMERCRRGKLHGGRQGRVSILGAAPYGYRYVKAIDGAAAQYNPYLPEASVVQQIFQWVGVEGVTLRQVCQRLEKQGFLSPTGMKRWSPSTLTGMLRNPAYKGSAAYGKTHRGPMRPRLRSGRNRPALPRNGQSCYRVPAQEWIGIPVAALVDEQLFDVVARQLEENRRRKRERHQGARYLLAGLVVCSSCGYACCGTRHSPTFGGRGYYRCLGNDGYRFGGKPACRSKSVKQDQLDQMVWNDVHNFLADPSRVKDELRRRIEGGDEDPQHHAQQKLDTQIGKVRRGITRLIDAYEEGLMEKSEFEPRIKSARQTLSQLQEQLKQHMDRQTQVREMKLVIDNLETFSREVVSRLEHADWETRREIIRTLIKQIEIGPEQIKIVYRVDTSPRPFDRSPARGTVQHCTRRLVA